MAPLWYLLKTRGFFQFSEGWQNSPELQGWQNSPGLLYLLCRDLLAHLCGTDSEVD